MQELARTTLTDRSVPDLLFRFSVATQAELKNVYGCWQGKHGLGAGGAEHAASRNGHPHLRLDPKSDVEAKALIERFDVEPAALPVVFCPGGQLFGLRLSDQRAPDLSHDRPR